MPHPAVCSSLIVLVTLLATPHAARADVRGVLRVGVAPVDLTAAEDTPIFGGPVGDAVLAYNAAADAYDAAHDGATMDTDAIGPRDLGVRGTLLTFAPGLEIGGDHAYVRLEAALGFGDDLRAIGIGFYPLNLAARLRRGRVVPYLSAGGAAGWLDRTTTDGELGALVTARVAVGVRLRDRVTLEVGYGVLLGGFYDRARLKTMSDYDPRGTEPPPNPDTGIAGGEQRGMIDVSIGLAL